MSGQHTHDEYEAALNDITAAAQALSSAVAAQGADISALTKAIADNAAGDAQIAATLKTLGDQVTNLSSSVAAQAATTASATTLPAWPNADTTGPMSKLPLWDITLSRPYPLDVISGDKFIVNTPGARYRGFKFPYLVEVRVPGVYFGDCLFVGPKVTPANSALLYVRPDAINGQQPSATVEDSAFIPAYPTYTIDGVRGSNFTLRRVEITKTVDGVHIHGLTTIRIDPNAGNVLVEDSWIHDLIKYGNPPDTSHSDGSHNDGIQIVGGKNIIIRRNRIDGTLSTSALLITQTSNDVSNLTIIGNMLGAAPAAINVSDKPTLVAIANLAVIDNVFVKGKGYAGLVTAATRAVTTWSGNVWTTGVTPLPTMAAG